MATVKSRVSETTKQGLTAAANKAGVSESKLVNSLIMNHLKSIEDPKKK